MLTIHNLNQKFTGHTHPTLHNISLTLHTGDFCMLMGHNGSGKSTLFQIILGTLSCPHGTLLLNGEDLHRYSRKQRAERISCVTQDISEGCIPELTVLDNMVLAQSRIQSPRLRYYQHDYQFFFNQVASLGLGLEQHLNTPMQALSGGQRQAIAILMAVSFQPQLLLLDEHTSALDPQSQRQLMHYIANTLTTQQITCLMITHDIDEALYYGNRLILLQHGKIVQNFNAAEKATLSKETLLKLLLSHELGTPAEKNKKEIRDVC